MEGSKNKSLNHTLETGVGLIILGLLLPILGRYVLWLVPFALILFGVFKIVVRKSSQEGFASIILGVVVWFLSRFFRGIIGWVGGAMVLLGVVVLVLYFLNRSKK